MQTTMIMFNVMWLNQFGCLSYLNEFPRFQFPLVSLQPLDTIVSSQFTCMQSNVHLYAAFNCFSRTSFIFLFDAHSLSD